MGKLLKPKDILLLGLAGVGDILQEIRDPLHLVSDAYKATYGFVPKAYKRQNFTQVVSRSIKTRDIEKVIKDGKVYLRLTSRGTKNIHRDFPILSLSQNWNKKWVLVIFDIEESSRKIRNLLRAKLKSLGFGMLQQSVWITPLPIVKDMIEFIESKQLAKYAFVLEVSHVLLGNPRELARKVWHLDKLEMEWVEAKEAVNSIETVDGRLNNRYKVNRDNNEDQQTTEKIERKIREVRKKKLELFLALPFLTKELLSNELLELF